MKLKKDFVLRQVAGTWVVLPLGDTAVDFNGMLTLNETGTFLWQALEKETEREKLVESLLAEYNVSREIALTDVDAFLDKLMISGCLEAE